MLRARTLLIDFACFLVAFGAAAAALPQPKACGPARELPAAVARAEAR